MRGDLINRGLVGAGYVVAALGAVGMVLVVASLAGFVALAVVLKGVTRPLVAHLWGRAAKPAPATESVQVPSLPRLA